MRNPLFRKIADEQMEAVLMRHGWHDYGSRRDVRYVKNGEPGEIWLFYTGWKHKINGTPVSEGNSYRDLNSYLANLEPVPQGGFYRSEKRVAPGGSVKEDPFAGLTGMVDLFHEYDGWQPVEIRKSVVQHIPGFTAAFSNPNIGIIIVYSDGKAWVHYDSAGNQTENHGTDIITLDKFLADHGYRTRTQPKSTPKTKEPEWNLSEEDKTRLHGMGVAGSLHKKVQAAYMNGYAEHANAYLRAHGNTGKHVKEYAEKNGLKPDYFKEAIQTMSRYAKKAGRKHFLPHPPKSGPVTPSEKAYMYDNDLVGSSLEREDFSYDARRNGYTLYYKGKNIGGAASMGKGSVRDMKQFGEQARIDINQIIEGRGQERYKKVIDEIDSIKVSKLKKKAAQYLDDEWRELLAGSGWYPNSDWSNGEEDERWSNPGTDQFIIIDFADGNVYFVVWEQTAGMQSEAKPITKGKTTEELERYLGSATAARTPKPKPEPAGIGPNDVPEFSEADKARLHGMGVKAKLADTDKAMLKRMGFTRRRAAEKFKPVHGFKVPAESAAHVAQHLSTAGLFGFGVDTDDQTGTSYFQFESNADLEVAHEIVRQAFKKQIAADKPGWAEWKQFEPFDSMEPVQRSMMSSKHKTAWKLTYIYKDGQRVSDGFADKREAELQADNENHLIDVDAGSFFEAREEDVPWEEYNAAANRYHHAADLDACIYCKGQKPKNKEQRQRLKDTPQNRAREISLYKALTQKEKTGGGAAAYDWRRSLTVRGWTPARPINGALESFVFGDTGLSLSVNSSGWWALKNGEQVANGSNVEELLEYLAKLAKGKMAGTWGERSYDSDGVHDILDRYRDGGGGFDTPIKPKKVPAILNDVDNMLGKHPDWTTKQDYFGVMVFLAEHGTQLDAGHKAKAVEIGHQLLADEHYISSWRNPDARKAMLEKELELFGGVLPMFT